MTHLLERHFSGGLLFIQSLAVLQKWVSLDAM